jgi:hypothetical protein
MPSTTAWRVGLSATTDQNWQVQCLSVLITLKWRLHVSKFILRVQKYLWFLITLGFYLLLRISHIRMWYQIASYCWYVLVILGSITAWKVCKHWGQYGNPILNRDSENCPDILKWPLDGNFWWYVDRIPTCTMWSSWIQGKETEWNTIDWEELMGKSTQDPFAGEENR